ncbi:head-tail connector protein [Novosphingobium olei]|uniref:head-tail connector protein n=1 Tax=Novosphingobium olei TaxID=2728851 RepID=UPI003088B113|nr:head-tail connector protein [Novosphingobium olei]
MGLTLVTGPIATAVTLAEVKAQAGIESADWDALLTADIAAATELIERRTGSSICGQAWRLTLDVFPAVVQLPGGPVTAVSSITYRDSAGIVRTLSSAAYIVDLVSVPGRIMPATAWPATDGQIGGVTVDFQTGFQTVPALLKKAIITTVSAWYRDRESGDLPAGVVAMLNGYTRSWGFA